MNQLAGQKSPYLLQHADNPVDWYPWSEEAFAKAKREDKPIFLSIGYSTCHWCHVMEKESFVDTEVAALMNGAFVSVKVDREERPDVDAHYMGICQLLTGSGGWPLSIVLTPEGRAFYAATYIPKGRAYGRAGLLELLPQIAGVWRTRREEVLASAESIASELGKAQVPAGPGFSPDRGAAKTAFLAVAQGHDEGRGGFGSAPKFPMPGLYPLLLRYWKREADPEALAIVESSLRAMRNGGIYDQVGGGFHRYSTDAAWLLPHFEKMLYDQALLALAYVEAWQATGDAFYEGTAREVLAYLRRDLGLPGGAFATAEDADDPGGEGSFYLWRMEELGSLLGEGAVAFAERHGAREEGNFAFQGETRDGRNILHRAPGDSEPADPRLALLLEARSGRARPARDDKVLADWNGLAIAALARAAWAFGDPELLDAALAAAGFIHSRLASKDGRLLHRWREGEAAITAFAEDYAFLAWGQLELYGASFASGQLAKAVNLVDSLLAHHWDGEGGGFFQAAADAAEGFPRSKPLYDGALPSANSVALALLLRLHRITGRPDFAARAADLLALYPSGVAEAAMGSSYFLAAADFAAGPTRELVIVGDPEAEDTAAFLRALRRAYLPDLVLILKSTREADPELERLAPWTAPLEAIGGKATAYLCEDFACRLPTTEPEALGGLLGESRKRK